MKALLIVLLMVVPAFPQTQEQVLKDTIETLRKLGTEPVPGPYDKIDLERKLDQIEDAIIFNALRNQGRKDN